MSITKYQTSNIIIVKNLSIESHSLFVKSKCNFIICVYIYIYANKLIRDKRRILFNSQCVKCKCEMIRIQNYCWDQQEFVNAPGWSCTEELSPPLCGRPQVCTVPSSRKAANAEEVASHQRCRHGDVSIELLACFKKNKNINK